MPTHIESFRTMRVKLPKLPASSELDTSSHWQTTKADDATSQKQNLNQEVTPEDGTYYQKLGGKDKLREVITDFIKRVYDDPIIGFFFKRIDQPRLIQREIEFASLHLGGPKKYTGRMIGPIHQTHPINRGHFHRRIWILEQTLQAHNVAPDVIEHWLEHNRKLENIVTNQKDCQD